MQRAQPKRGPVFSGRPRFGRCSRLVAKSKAGSDAAGQGDFLAVARRQWRVGYPALLGRGAFPVEQGSGPFLRKFFARSATNGQNRNLDGHCVCTMAVGPAKNGRGPPSVAGQKRAEIRGKNAVYQERTKGMDAPPSFRERSGYIETIVSSKAGWPWGLRKAAGCRFPRHEKFVECLLTNAEQLLELRVSAEMLASVESGVKFAL